MPGPMSQNALVLQVLALVVTMLTGLLFYKFHSHNRYVGYCKLLAQEQYSGLESLGEFYLWESCMARLRAYDMSKANREKLVAVARRIDAEKSIKGLPSAIAPKIKETTTADWKHLAGLQLFL